MGFFKNKLSSSVKVRITATRVHFKICYERGNNTIKSSALLSDKREESSSEETEMFTFSFIKSRSVKRVASPSPC